jgi:hypothetical protein
MLCLLRNTRNYTFIFAASSIRITLSPVWHHANHFVSCCFFLRYWLSLRSSFTLNLFLFGISLDQRWACQVKSFLTGVALTWKTHELPISALDIIIRLLSRALRFQTKWNRNRRFRVILETTGFYCCDKINQSNDRLYNS